MADQRKTFLKIRYQLLLLVMRAMIMANNDNQIGYSGKKSEILKNSDLYDEDRRMNERLERRPKPNIFLPKIGVGGMPHEA